MNDTSKRKFSFQDFTQLTPGELRIIGISLGILSIGIAIAWIGLVFVSSR